MLMCAEVSVNSPGNPWNPWSQSSLMSFFTTALAVKVMRSVVYVCLSARLFSL